MFVILILSPACCPIASGNSSGSANSSVGGGSLTGRVNASAAAAANAALLARRGSYPLNAVAALTAAQQRNLAALASIATTSTALTGSTGTPMVSVAATPHSSGVTPHSTTGQQHVANSLTAVAAAHAAQQQLHGLAP